MERTPHRLTADIAREVGEKLFMDQVIIVAFDRRFGSCYATWGRTPIDKAQAAGGGDSICETFMKGAEATRVEDVRMEGPKWKAHAESLEAKNLELRQTLDAERAKAEAWKQQLIARLRAGGQHLIARAIEFGDYP